MAGISVGDLPGTRRACGGTRWAAGLFDRLGEDYCLEMDAVADRDHYFLVYEEWSGFGLRGLRWSLSSAGDQYDE